MRIAILAMFVAVAGLMSGCSVGGGKAKTLDKTLRAYEHTVRWGKMEKINTFLKTPIEITPKMRDHMKHIQVTSYHVLSRSQSKVGLDQLVEIRYYNDMNAVERTMTDAQKWEYNEDEDRWYLLSPVPKFK